MWIVEIDADNQPPITGPEILGPLHLRRQIGGNDEAIGEGAREVEATKVMSDLPMDSRPVHEARSIEPCVGRVTVKTFDQGLAFCQCFKDLPGGHAERIGVPGEPDPSVITALAQSSQKRRHLVAATPAIGMW
jgi:hypothetical protein